MPPAQYPWDSHQQAAVHSTEIPDSQRHPTGLTHYRQILDEQRTYPKICTSFIKEYRHEGKDHAISTHNTTLDLDSPSSSTRTSAPDRTVDYTTRPRPPHSHSSYKSAIYHATTPNTAVCLAIIRIAEKNLPSIDFTSALIHLPNLAPSDPLPALPHGTFTGDIPFSALDTDVDITIAFLPEFYSDNRHALGFYVLLPGIAEPTRNRITSCVSTPCTTQDLEDWDMVIYSDGREGEGMHGMEAVGVEGGRWVDPDSVEDGYLWRTAWWVLERWEKRLAKTEEKSIEDV
ncbi:hypothetical protein NX059_002305 [Plenodomus lindquistii]|nr:hypothetical protein NX059_002305 [Plenodomus lindquistii]